MKLETGLHFKFSDLKGSLRRCCLQFPELRYKMEESKRRLKDSTRFREACSKCTDDEKKELLEMKKWLSGEESEGEDQESVAGSIELPSLPATPLMATPKKRKAVASATPEEKGQPDLDEEAEMATPLPSRKAKLKEKVLKRPAAVSPQKKPAAKKVEKKMEGKKSWVLMYYKRSKSTLKKPAAQQKAGMKRPAAHEKEEKPPKTHKKNGKDKEEEEEDDEIVEPLPLTEEALQSHNKFLSEMSKHKDMSQTQFDKTLATLPSRTAERLWKAFEACRKETGSDGQYKEASSGCGQQKKKRALLRGWCMDKGKPFQKWGAEELKDRLQKGTIKARRNPLDRDYWEFQAIVEKKSNMAEKVDHKKMAAIEAVAVDEVHSSDMELCEQFETTKYGEHRLKMITALDDMLQLMDMKLYRFPAALRDKFAQKVHSQSPPKAAESIMQKYRLSIHLILSGLMVLDEEGDD
ncbi:unnamed protein product [Cladocopium goreaui]|uniref:Uncharacterized protein n=1 Tax=Cladocopium goreaui TaxID=2562237 RepID=A0A9P1CQD2_9DINO|nr:unnamed protein product [Cladocopium goreaui]